MKVSHPMHRVSQWSNIFPRTFQVPAPSARVVNIFAPCSKHLALWFVAGMNFWCSQFRTKPVTYVLWHSMLYSKQIKTEHVHFNSDWSVDSIQKTKVSFYNQRTCFHTHAIHCFRIFCDASKVGEPVTLASWETTGPRPAIAPCTCEAVDILVFSFGLTNGWWKFAIINWEWTSKIVF